MLSVQMLMNVTSVLMIAILMQFVQILMDHTLVSVKEDLMVMVEQPALKHVSTTVSMGTVWELLTIPVDVI